MSKRADATMPCVFHGCRSACNYFAHRVIQGEESKW